jgi:hypothetical protein
VGPLNPPDRKKLDPSKYDFDKLHHSITDEVNKYNGKKFEGGHCQEWVEYLWATALARSKK